MATEESNRVAVEVREQFGKGAARRIRREHKIPAVLYGHGSEPQHLTLPGHQIMLLLRKSNAILELERPDGVQLALVKDVQRDPVKQSIEHLDLVVVRRGEKVTVEIPVHVEGEPVSGLIATLDYGSIEVEAEATHIPERFVVDVDGLEDGARITAADLDLPRGVTLLTDPETLVVGISEAPAPEPEEEAAAEEAAEAEAAESGEASDEAGSDSEE